MIDYKIHHQLHPSFLQLRDQVVDVFNGAINGVYSLIIGYIVSHVLLWTFVDYGAQRMTDERKKAQLTWRNPYYVNTQIFKVIKLRNDPFNIPPAITVAVEKG